MDYLHNSFGQCAAKFYFCRRFDQELRKMRKFILGTAALLCAATTAQAGGYLTNTNQSVAFLRNPAQDATFGIGGAYTNPAGLGFMAPGWHLGVDIQSAYQTRSDATYFAPFAMGTVNGVKNNAEGYKKFEGKAKAPVIPSFDLARVGERWFASFHFGITGGGGKCKFADGLPSFESQVAMLPVLVGAIAPGAVNGYSMDTHMQGRQYYFGGQFGVGYKITPNFNVSVGGRVLYAQCNYYGYVRNIGLNVNTAAGPVEMAASDFFKVQNLPDFANLVSDKELNCDQSGWGFTPIISADYKLGRLNLAARYEFKTRLRLKNQAGVNTSGRSEYDDGTKVKADVPAILAVGAQYSVLDNVRLNAGFHYYFDKQATQHENRHNYLKNGGWEVLAGAEVDVTKRWTVSAGWQTTNYGLGNNSQFISDLSFVTNSNSLGLGARFQLRKKVALNVAYFKTFYKHYERKHDDFYQLKGTFSSMLQPMAEKLTASAAQLGAALQNPNLSEDQRALYTQQLATLRNELGAAQQIATGLQGYSTAGTDNFHRTNDVFGLGLEIDF